MKTSREAPEELTDDAVLMESVEEESSNKNNFVDSESDEMTSQTGSVSEEEGWLGGMGADFRTLATSLKCTAGGVASFVQRSALSIAAEIAAIEKVEQVDGDERNSVSAEPLRLPWEIKGDDGSYEEVSELKEQIISLSLNESAFLPSKKSEGAEDELASSFCLDEPRIQLVRRLLELDENLAVLHAKLSGRSDFNETRLWGNYFRLCQEARDDHLKKYGPMLEIAIAHVTKLACSSSRKRRRVVVIRLC